MKVRVRRRLPSLRLVDLEDDEPELIPAKVPHGLRVNGTDYIFKTKPFAHQMAALRRVWLLNGGALLMEQGTGKTAVAIHFIGLKHRTEKITRVLIVGPVSTMGVWVREFTKHLPKEIDRKIYRLSGPRAQRIRKIAAAQEAAGLRIVIINYESAWRLSEQLRTFNPQIIIADESQRIKSPRAKQSKVMWRLGDLAKYRIILTGTPITGGAHDVWSQWNFHSPRTFGDNWWRFQAHYLIKGGYLRKETVGYNDLEGLKRKVRRDSFIIRKEECLDLPEKVFQTVPIQLSEESKRLYNTMAIQLVAEIEDGSISTAPIVLVKLLRLAQITSGFIKDIDDNIHEIGDEKLRTCVELIEDRVGDGHQVVVFARFRYEISRLEESLTKAGVSCDTLTGSTPPLGRDKLIENFQSGIFSVLIAQIQAGSLGITLTAADTAIFMSMDFSLGNYLQATDRLHRIGQKSTVTYLHLVVPHSIDALVYKVLREKKKLAEFILKRPRAILLTQ